MRTTTPFLLPMAFGICLWATSLFSQSNLQQSTSVNSTGAAADASAQLDVSSTDKGMLVPRMTSAQRTAIATPATGLLVFDTDTGGFWFYNGTVWADLSSPKTLADADGNTQIQVEESPNEDIIRFDLGGTEHFVMDGPRLEVKNSGQSVFIGNGAGANDDLSNNRNVAVGDSALYSNTTGFHNTATGHNALRSNTTGSNNIANGIRALQSNTSGTNNIANGTLALQSNTTGSFNTANGRNALFSNTTAHDNSAYGASALYSNTTGSVNIAYGANALYSNTTGHDNTAYGANALYSNKANHRSTVIGRNAMYFADDRTTGRDTYNTAVGYEALRGSGTAANNTGQYNTAVGGQALLSNTTGSNNTANGYKALFSNNTGIDNIAIGSLALHFNTDGEANEAIGKEALYNNIGGNYNIGIGIQALYSNTSGSNNTAAGRDALHDNTTGSGNTAFGWNALDNNTTGNNNTALGRGADVISGTLTNATAIGYFASVNASNKVRIGNGSVTVIEGQVDWTFPSDARFKFNIHDETVPGLAFIEKLRPVTYQFDTRKFDQHLMQDMPDSIQQRLAGQDYSESTELVQTGFLAQEVEQVCKDLDFEFSGLHVPTSEVDNYGLAYGSFVPLLVKAVQEQQKIIENSLSRELGRELKMENLEAENSILKTELQAYKSQLDTITAALQSAGIVAEK